MMGRWGLEGMRSFEQHNVARKEGKRLEGTPSFRPTQTSESSINL